MKMLKMLSKNGRTGELEIKNGRKVQSPESKATAIDSGLLMIELLTDSVLTVLRHILTTFIG